MISLGYSL
ncbi:hypothetical protein VCHC78A1_03314A, partial [Vibrio cholerae HC-78A1]